ncbi:MAG: hypothetical protein JKY56_09085, partial [Kofleriaceae bacterium]|nr:hypothetical protein [Kofleriaceae bacterium]
MGNSTGALEVLGATSFTADLLSEFVRLRDFARRLRRSMREVGAPSVPVHNLLRTSELDITVLALLASTDRVFTRLGIVAAHLDIREAGLNPRQVANLVLGWDHISPEYFPATGEAVAFLESLRASFTGEVEARLALVSSDAGAQASFAASDAADAAAFYRRLYSEEVISLAVSEAMNVPTESVEALLGIGATAAVRASDGVRSSIEDFLDFITAPAASVDLSTASETLTRLSRAARYVAVLGIRGSEITAFEAVAPIAGLFSINVTPQADEDSGAATKFAAFTKSVRHAQLLKSWPTNAAFATMADTTLYAGRDFADSATFKALEDATGWSRSEIRETLAALSLTSAGAMQRVETYERLEGIITTARRYSVSPSVVVSWAGPANPAATALRAVAKARTSSISAWHELLTPVSDRARERRRDCLLALVLRARGLSSADELYAQLLIDPQMAACAQTSRVKAAASSVQLFIQRLLLGIESVRLDESAKDHWKQWEWMKNYRVWEANRKVFLYPENWVYFELRDDKSELFVALEDELLESDISSATATRALHKYVESFDRIARLDLRAVYFDADADGGEPGSDAKGVLHLFARTRSQPHTYFHRRRLPSQAFTPWEKIDLGIQGNHLVPFMSDGRLVLLWVNFRAMEKDDAIAWVIDVKWAEEHEDGWGPEQSGPDNRTVFSNVGIPPEDVLVRVNEQSESVVIDIFGFEPALRRRDYADELTVAKSLWSLRFVRCTRRLELLPRIRDEEGHLIFKIALLCPRTTIQSMHLTEKVEGMSALALVSNTREESVRSGGSQVFHAIEKIDSLRRTPVIELLRSPPDGFRVLPSHQRPNADGELPFVVDLGERTYLVTPKERRIHRKRAPGDFNRDPFRTARAFQFEHLYHPYSCHIAESLSRGGVDGLLAPPRTVVGASIDRQSMSEFFAGGERFPTFTPNRVLEPYPSEEFEFEEHQALSTYNWEMFFHIPLLVAERLTQNRKYEEARNRLHYIFDPTDISGHTGLKRFWRMRPFFEDATGSIETIDDVLERIAARNADDEARVAAWREDPFNPHRVARQRRSAYMRAVVMKYLDTLIAWGDDLFARDS